MGIADHYIYGIKMQGLIAREELDKGATRKQALAMAAKVAASVEKYVPGEGDYRELIYGIGGSVGLAWLSCGFPTIEPSHRLAASLMCSVIPQDVAKELQMPWRCFSICIPGGLISDNNEHVIVLASRSGGISTFYFSEDTFAPGGEPDLAGYADESIVLRKQGPEAPPFDISKDYIAKEEKKLRLVGRLICGVCAEMESKALSTGKKPKYPNGINKRGEPSRWTFKLMRPVRVDTREAVRSYVEGQRGGKLSVQHLVRGHHKQQRWGRAGQDRKWIHIEPYWRGDPDAPIALRPHKVR